MSSDSGCKHFGADVSGVQDAVPSCKSRNLTSNVPGAVYYTAEHFHRAVSRSKLECMTAFVKCRAREGRGCAQDPAEKAGPSPVFGPGPRPSAETGSTLLLVWVSRFETGHGRPELVRRGQSRPGHNIRIYNHSSIPSDPAAHQRPGLAHCKAYHPLALEPSSEPTGCRRIPIHSSSELHTTARSRKREEAMLRCRPRSLPASGFAGC